ncbi:MAG: hypothetical protein P8L46_01255 [Acidimicrobiales bacterium]|nr:hypothetical protein [Acidimicrobiales bacterium]MDG2216652.1 hypothetical protein [Acidimicrobiales bacterium]
MFTVFKSGVSLGGVSAADEDVLGWDGAACSLMFDGSDVGVDALEIDGLDVLSTDQVLISFTTSGSVPGIGTVDGSDVALTRNGEDIDGLSLLDSGDLLISTK